MKDTKAKVYNLIKSETEIEYQDIANKAEISIEEVQRICEELENEGLIEHPEDEWMWDYIWQHIRKDKDG